MRIDKDKVAKSIHAYPALRTLLGSILSERLSAPDPSCYLLHALEIDVHHVLNWWEERCRRYLDSVISPADVVTKLSSDLIGHARKDAPQDFNERVGDAIAEISAVYELAKRGCSQFLPLLPSRVGKGVTIGAADYRCLVAFDASDGQQGAQQKAYVEVKNLRTPVGIIDVFARAYKRAAEKAPVLNTRRIVLTYHWDNTVTPEQCATINAFMDSLAGYQVPYGTTLDLPGKVAVGVKIIEGRGDVCLIRPIGGDHPDGPFTDSEKFLNKATAAIRKAVKQLSQYEDGLRLIVLNIQSPDATVASESGIRLQEIVTTESSGTAHCILLHHHHFIEP